MLTAMLTAVMCLPAQSPQMPPAPEEPTLRITVTLVQVDAVVVDSKGKPVTDLKPEDFEVRQDGKVQKITHFSYITAAQRSPKAIKLAPKAKAVDKLAPPVPPTPMKASQVKRTVAVIVDDLGLSFESIAQVRQALKKFVDEQVQPGDLVAIIRTGGGIGALQQFTSDKRMLYAAIERVKWNFHGRAGVSAFAPIEESSVEGEDAAAAASETETEFREEQFSVGTLGAISYVIDGLRELPGRKSVVVLSDNIPIMQSTGMNSRIMESLEKLCDLANRAAVVIYTIDPRGLPTLGFSAADRITNTNPAAMQEKAMARSAKYFESQNGLNYLAEQTGGLFIHDTNDIAKGINEVLDDQSGYYLLGYSPQHGTFDKDLKNQKFHRVSVKVLRPGLHARSRSGFLGVPDRDRPVTPSTREQQIASALTSPFGATGIKVRLTSLFADNLKNGPYVQSLLYIDPKDLKFSDEPDDWHKAVIDVVTMTFGDNGQEVDRNDRTYTIRMHAETYQDALKKGFVYSVNHPVKKPGAFQMRAVVRDVATRKTGSASRFIEVPDLKKGRLALSGIVVKAADPALVKANNPAAAAKQSTESGRIEDSSDGSPAVRRFRPGQAITYGFQVINSKAGSKSPQPKVDTELRLFRDGKPVYSGKPVALAVNGQTDPKRIISGGLLRLGAKMTPGEYVLQVIATDALANEKYRKASNWIDFEVAP